ncbi:M48 family metallopeptidase [Rubrobacter aplysinae]|uniref:M48 family metallopeptidase n=1 Tax=Rubrobacter aplysinae TaxID=909625 RepID=UPI00064C1017|nr:M48 family metallopeptidase [Rubrobacter aplysinae]
MSEATTGRVPEGTFRDRIAQNRRNSLLLIVSFLALVVVLGYIIGFAWTGDPAGALFGLALAIVAGTVSGLITYFGGARMVLATSGAKEVSREEAPVLHNVIEEMALAGGLSMPKVYVIEDASPNAFATGRDPEHAAVAATSGLIERLDRDELQGVMAHEMAHVGNLDIRYAMLVGVLVGTTVLISDFFLRSLWLGGGRRRGGDGNGQAQLIMMAVALLFAILAPIFARLLQMSISRQREYLADATAIRFTRNPGGLADALEKITASSKPLKTANRATAHLYIANPLKKRESAKRLFSTHPPPEERIRRLRAMQGAPAEPEAETGGAD